MSAKLINIPLDLETLSLQEDAAIIQIGCCIPDFDRGNIPPGVPYEFEATVKYEEALQSEFHKDHQTMDWWEKQDALARAQVFSGQDSYEEVFDQFVYWIKQLKSQGADVAIWGNGSDFDNRLLAYSLAAFGHTNVWSFRNNRDLRTMRAICPVEIEKNLDGAERPHTALGDARYEARIISVARAKYALYML